MKNKVLQLLMLFCFACFGMARATVVTIGTGTNTGQNSLPVKTDWNYSLTQQIFTADEVGMSGAINAISFNYTNSAGAFSMSDIQVYMKHVSTTQFNSSSDMVMVGPSDKVFEGTFSASGAGWVTVNLDTPFIYDGNNNLLICFYTPVANFVGSYGNMFYYTNTYTNTEENIYSSMALYSSSYIDFTNIDYDFVAWANYNFRANIQIDITPIMSIPFTENFTTSSPPGNWTRYRGWLNHIMNGTASLTTYTGDQGWRFGTANGVFNNHARINIWSNVINYWLLTPIVAMQNNCQLTFELALTKYYGTLQPAVSGEQPDDRFVVLASTDYGSTWTILREWNNTGSSYVYDNILLAGEDVAIDLSAYQGTNLMIAFYGESKVANNGDNNLHIDNVSIDYIPTCQKPTNFHVSDIAERSVVLTWDAPADQNHWEVGYKTDSDPYYMWWTEPIETPYLFSGHPNNPLQPETHYTVKIRPICGTTYGSFSKEIDFTTLEACPVPTNLTITNVTPHGVTAVFEPGSPTQTLWSFNYTTTNVPPTYANGTTFSHTINYPEYWEAFQSNTHYYLWVGIECPEDNNNYHWGEPAEFTTPEACPAVDVSHEVEIEDVQPHSVSLSWEAYQGMATQWQVFYNLYPYLPNDENYINEVAVVTDEPYVTIDSLLGDYDYHFWIRSYCGEWHNEPEWSSWSDMITAHTLVSCPAPTNLVVRTTANSAIITWTPGQPDQHLWTVEIMSEDWGDYPPTFEVDVPYITFDEEFLDGMIDDGNCYEKSFTVYVYEECGGEDGTSEAAELEFIVTDRQFVTVYDGEDVNNRIPAYIYYFDDFTKSQFVIPAEDLTEMIGTPISSMTFYTEDLDTYDYTTLSPANVFLLEVDYTEISEFEPSGQNVYTGYFHIEKRNGHYELTINFSTPYIYQGGNLLVGIENTVDNGYKNIYFYGQTVNGASISGSNGSSTGTIPAEQQNFIPKTTFGFLPTCEPKSLPYSYGFEDDSELDCWTMLDCHYASGISSNAYYEGGYGFEFHWNTTPPQYLISPQFEGTTGMNVSFSYKNYSDTYPETFQVGYSTTTKSSNAFIWGDEVTAYGQTWHLYEAFYPIGTKYVAVKLTSDDMYFLYLDNFNFEPALCMDEDQCELTFTLHDSWGDGWNGAAINVRDVATNELLASVSAPSHGGGNHASIDYYSLFACDGRELRFEWVNGEYDNECGYSIADLNGNIVLSGGSSELSEPFYYTTNCTKQYIFIVNGNWNNGGNWNYAEVPDEGSDVIIRADAVIPAGYTAYAYDVVLDGGSITIEDGGQLWHRTNGLEVTMKKNIVGYGDTNNQNHYYLLAHPFNENIPVPEEMKASGCDLYKFNELEPEAEWRNNRQEPINELRQLSGYLFASPIDMELSFTGSTMKSGSYYLPEVEYYEDPNSNFNGWALWGNFLTCNIYVYTKDDEGEYVPMDVMVYNEAGEKVMLSAGPIPPMSAYFLKLTQSMAVYFLYYRVKPEGVINSLFTVNSNGDQVRFSQGNLQYIGSASTPYWKFADNQWEILGDNGQGSTSQNVDRDLFGWGTSGYNHGSVCYQPWSTSEVYADYRPYGSTTTNLYDETGKAEWGYNAISNGGNTEHLGWRTMTRSEWGYVFNQRTTPSGIRYAKAIVNGVKGMVLLPDDWNASYYSLNATNTPDVNFTSNTISASQWSILEEHGAVFLPESGWRSGTDLNNLTSYGTYWSSQEGNNTHAGCINFNDTYFSPTDTGERSRGFSVRLVFPTR